MIDSSRVRVTALVTLAAFLITMPAAAGGSPQYTITDLGPAPPGIWTTAESINNHGEAAGQSSSESGASSTLWLPAPAYGLPAGPNDIGHLGVSGGRAYGINDFGQCVGFAPNPASPDDFVAWFWDPIDGMTPLGSFGGTHSIANAINNNGWVVGDSDTTDPDVYRAAFLWDGTQMIDLGAFERGAFQSKANDINDLNQVVGLSMYLKEDNPTNGDLHAYIWLPEPAYGLPAGMHDLDPTGEPGPTSAHGINNKGQVAIWGADPLNHAQYYVAFWLWLPEPDYGLPAGTTDLRGPYGGASTAFARDINERGEVVFRANIDPDNAFGDWRAMVWRQGEWIDLIEAIPPADQAEWSFGSASDINDRGEIVGWGTRNGSPRGFLLTPVLDDACPADVNGDREIDVNDLNEVIVGWGPCFEGLECPADITGDGMVGVDDLVEVIVGWGSCDAPGACCFTLTGDCETLPRADCEFMGGTWNAGATCETFACPAPPSGACCLVPSGDCIDANAFECDLLEGNWYGPPWHCGNLVCPQSLEGDWIGNPIPVTGLPYSTVGNSAIFSDYYDAQCDFHAAAPDVVYAYTPTRDEVVNISTCLDSAYDTKLYVFENDEDTVVACDDDTCATPSYPFEYVARIDSVEMTAGETYYIVVDGFATESGEYTLDIESVTNGACCTPDSLCTDLSLDICDIVGGVWFAGEACGSFACPPLPTGACCDDGGVCIANQTEWECVELFGGAWQGEGTSCFGANCP